jgi:catechol 2,3-dioxygenase-like lactoylglutathione lyase family enzyme
VSHDVDGGAGQVFRAQLHARLTNGQDFRVCGRVVGLRNTIRAFGENFAVRDDHRRERSAAVGHVLPSDLDGALCGSPVSISSSPQPRRLAARCSGNSIAMIGKLRSVVVDCKDPNGLAAFYAELLGGTLAEEDDSWVVVTDRAGHRLAFQRAPQHQPPRFPDPRGSQQFHLDIQVDDVDSAEREVLALGATRVTDAVGENYFRVFRDPAGHTFCLVWGITD